MSVSHSLAKVIAQCVKLLSQKEKKKEHISPRDNANITHIISPTRSTNNKMSCFKIYKARRLTLQS